jgi:SAM-dependent MidA family methyltransferase
LADFVELALYDPEVGYYATSAPRVGTQSGTDFTTSARLHLVFGPLVAAASAALLEPHVASEFVFVEIGAEPGTCILDGVEHPFRDVRTIRLGAPLDLPAKAVIFSNELFDAQPFSRVVRQAGRWHEMGVRMAGGRFEWAQLAEPTGEIRRCWDRLPSDAPEGYTIDLPLRAEALLRDIIGKPWAGLFLTLDYGRTWSELCREYPRGTARAYRRHRLSDDLLQQPGEQDLTCHVCWDWLEGALAGSGFAPVRRMPQESFFLHHASAAVSKIVASGRSPLAPARAQLRQLLHPALMGQRFEVLWGRR